MPFTLPLTSARRARWFWRFLLACSMLVGGVPAHAATCSATLSSMAFGSLGFLNTPVDSTASVQVTCQAGAQDPSSTIQVCPLIGPSVAGGSGASHALTSTGGHPALTYGVFSDAAHSVPWGNLSSLPYPSISMDLSSGSPVSQTMTVYGRVPAPQTPYGNDTYSDSPVVTLDYGFSSCTQGVSVNVGSLNVSALDNPTCTVSALPLNFGTQGLLQSYVDGSSTVQAACTMGTTYTITFGAGNGPGSTPQLRYMSNGSHTLAYTLYTNAARSTVWTDVQGVQGTGTGTSVDVPVYARIPAQTPPPPGVYNDQVVVTISY